MLSVSQVADRLGWDRRRTLEHLQMLHEKYGGLLFRRPRKRSKIWVDEAKLVEVWDRFGQAPTAGDLLILHRRIDRAEELAERALRELGRHRRGVAYRPMGAIPDNS